MSTTQRWIKYDGDPKYLDKFLDKLDSQENKTQNKQINDKKQETKTFTSKNKQKKKCDVLTPDWTILGLLNAITSFAAATMMLLLMGKYAAILFNYEPEKYKVSQIDIYIAVISIGYIIVLNLIYRNKEF